MSRLGGVVLAALVLGAVTLTAPPAGAAASSKTWARPCAIVKKSDVEKTVGATIVRTKSNPGPVKACLYYQDSSALAAVSIWLNDKPLTGTAANQFAFDAKQAKSNSANHGYETVRGVGKKAFFF